MGANDRKATLRAINTITVNQAVNRQEVNVVLDDRAPLINNSEKDLTRKERITLAQLRSGHCRLTGSYKSRINKDDVVVVRLSVHVHFNLGLSPRDS